MSEKSLHVVITGASMGLGAALAESCVAMGASVVLCARGVQALNKTVSRLRQQASPEQIIAAVPCDVTNEEQVDNLLKESLRVLPHIDALINNAGVYGPIGEIGEVNWNEWKEAIAINLFGTVYSSRVFAAHFKQRNYGKIVNLSGGGATNPLPRISSYAAAKAAIVRFTETLAEELKPFHIDVNAIAPGVLDTRLTQQLLEAGRDVVGEKLYDRVSSLAADGKTSMQKASDLATYLCSPASDGVTGRLISALWDPWAELHERRDELEGSDIYTLRRIVPKDRGKNWGG